MSEKVHLHWQAHEYEDVSRSSDWYWAVGIFTVAIAVTSIILNNVLFALVILLGGFGLILYAIRRPKLIDITIGEKGVQIEKYFYPYHTLESFWVEEHEHRPKILIKSQKLFMPYITIPLGDLERTEVKEALSRHLPEIFHSESFFHKLLEYLGF